MFRKRVRCSDCGFLGRSWTGNELDNIECPPKVRTIIIVEGAHTEPSYLSCNRGICSERDIVIDKESNRPKEVAAFVNIARKCFYFFRYQPGYTPAEHRELQREAQTRRLLTRNMLLAATIGAGAAILAQHLAR